jgi:putative copper resistance protein D
MSYGFLDIARLVFMALQNLSFATMVGVLLSARWLKGPVSEWQGRVNRKLASVFTTTAVATLLFSAIAFWIHCTLMSEVPLQDAGPAVVTMLRTTLFGHVWAIAAVLMLCIVAISLVPKRRPGIALQPVVWILIAGVALAKSNAGHPVDAGTLSLPVWADWVHMLAISCWVGIVLVATFIVSPGMKSAGSGDLSGGAAFVQAMSDAATVALIALFATGAYNGWRGVAAPANIVGSWYGQVLIFKLVLVLVAAALGGHNRFFEMPSLLASLRDSSANHTRHLRRFSTVLHVESWVLIGVVAIAAVLVSSPLPGTE